MTARADKAMTKEWERVIAALKRRNAHLEDENLHLHRCLTYYRIMLVEPGGLTVALEEDSATGEVSQKKLGVFLDEHAAMRKKLRDIETFLEGSDD